MAKEKQLSAYEQAVLDTAVHIDMDVKVAQRVIDVFFGVVRDRLIKLGLGVRVPNFGYWLPKRLVGRNWKANGRQGKSQMTVGVRFTASRRMVESMRAKYKAGEWGFK